MNAAYIMYRNVDCEEVNEFEVQNHGKEED